MKRLTRAFAILAVAALAMRCGTGAASPSSGPQFGFNWSGVYTIQSCVDSGDATGACATAPVGQTAQYSLSLTQDGQTVSGPSTLGTAVFPSATATIAKDGSLSLTSTLATGALTQSVTWILKISNSQLEGTFTAVASDAGGFATLTGRIATAVRQ